MNSSVGSIQPVLYIDNDNGSAAVLAELFARRPHLCLHHARSGAEASDLAQQFRPALLLVAAQLPDCTGSELAPLLRVRHRWGSVPVVGLTWLLPLTGAGAFNTIWLKPLDTAIVLRSLDHWLPAPARSAAPVAPQAPADCPAAGATMSGDPR